jgi:membrane protein YdbS with pleckstrin-like domain
MPVMTEKDFPITVLWIFKSPIIFILISLVAIMFGYYFPYLLIATPFLLVANPLTRRAFHYTLDEEYFHIRQGVLSKKERHLPYGVIQNVLVKQDLFDRIFGLASLRIENAANAGSEEKTNFWTKQRGLFKSNTPSTSIHQPNVGASGNAVNIPGLKKDVAEAFKLALLQKMKEHAGDNHNSGL